ncbi:hypothetical protein EV359DRAFT_84202 [Lentinula novae-zelandiae]|nr:hypothetical protein EV359DRAFT_84202 [Lentinula novae-zelandiae]
MPFVLSRLALVELSRALIPYKVPSTAMIVHPSMPIHHKKDLDIAQVREPHLGALQQLLASYKGKKTNNPDKATISVLRRSTEYLHDLLVKPVTLRSHVRQISNLTACQSIIDTLCLGHKLFPDIVSDSHFEQHLKFMAFANDARSFRTLSSGIVSSIMLEVQEEGYKSSRDVKRELRSVCFDSDVEMNSASEDELVSGTERSFKQKPALSFIKNRRSTPYPTTGSNKGSNKDEKSAVNDVSPRPGKIHCHTDSHASSNLTHSKHINHALAQVISSNLNTPPAPLESQSTKFIAATSLVTKPSRRNDQRSNFAWQNLARGLGKIFFYGNSSNENAQMFLIHPYSPPKLIMSGKRQYRGPTRALPGMGSFRLSQEESWHESVNEGVGQGVPLSRFSLIEGRLPVYAATLNFQAAEFKFNANLVKNYATRARIAKVIADEACSILKSRQDSGSDSSASDTSFATAQSIPTTGSEDTVVTPMEIAVPVIKTIERATTPFTRGVTPMMEDKGHVSA